MLRDSGHLHCITHRLDALKQLFVSRSKRIERGLLAPKLGGAGGLAITERQLGQPVEGGAVARVGSDEPLEGLALRLGIAAPRGEPGSQAVDLRRGRPVGRQVLERLPGLRGATGRHRPLQPRPPDRHILGAAAKAGVEPSRRLVEGTLADRQVGLPQPDPIIVRGLPLDALQEGANRLGGRRPHALGDVQPEQLDGLVRTASSSPVQQYPVGLDQS